MSSAARYAFRQSHRQASAILNVGRRTIVSPKGARALSATAAPAPSPSSLPETENVNHVRDAIGKLLAKEDAEIKPISNEELEMGLARFANLFEEARACINDCREARAGSLEFYEESFTAQKSVDEVFNAYIDLLDDFRRASDDQLKLLCQDRLSLANSLKTLRQEVDEMAQQKQTAA